MRISDWSSDVCSSDLNAPIGLAIVGLDGRFKTVNPALHEMLGYSEFELLGMTFQDLTHPDDLARDMAYTEQLLSGERDQYRTQTRYFHRLGHTVYIQLDVTVLRGADRSEERSVGERWAGSCRARRAQEQ